MKGEKEYPIEYIATINAAWKHEKSVSSLMSCVLDYWYSLMKPLDDKNKGSVHAALITERKARIIDNFSYLPRIACAYTVGFDKFWNTALLLARKDLPKLQRHLTPRKIDQIQRYHPKNNELQQWIEWLLEWVDKRFALEHLDNTAREEVERRMNAGTLERICKLLGGKDDIDIYTNEQLTARSNDTAIYDDVLKREVREESWRQKLISPTPFAEIIEIKETIIKMCRIYVSKFWWDKWPKKFSVSEIDQDLVEIYIPIDLAWMILHETFTAKVRSLDPDHRRKMSSCARSLLVIDYFKDHQNQLMQLLR